MILLLLYNKKKKNPKQRDEELDYAWIKGEAQDPDVICCDICYTMILG